MVRLSASQLAGTDRRPSSAQCDCVSRAGPRTVAATGAASGIDQDLQAAAERRHRAQGGLGAGIGARAAIDAARRQAALRYRRYGRLARSPARASQEDAPRYRHRARGGRHQSGGPGGPPSMSAIQIPRPRAPTTAIEIAGRRTITRKRKDRSSLARSSRPSSVPVRSEPTSPPCARSACLAVERSRPPAAPDCRMRRAVSFDLRQGLGPEPFWRASLAWVSARGASGYCRGRGGRGRPGT